MPEPWPLEWMVPGPPRGLDAGEDLTVGVVAPSGASAAVPAYRGGDGEWRVRYAPRETGRHRWFVEPGAPGARGPGSTSGPHGTFEVLHLPQTGLRRPQGGLRVSPDRRHLEQIDGTPFFWLADTWWMALSTRLAWPDEFAALTRDRVEKGFTVIQLVAGLFPDMDFFDRRGANEAGLAIHPDGTVNPAFFDAADGRIAHLVEAGLVPCIVGAWGQYLDLLGLAGMRRYWRNLVARYAAYPVVWCIAGEASRRIAWLSNDAEANARRRGWTEVARYVRSIDPVGHPITIHGMAAGRPEVDSADVLDLDLLQIGHFGRDSIRDLVDMVQASYASEPVMPTIVGEGNYEGLLGESWEDVQRGGFWMAMLNGAAGHTYGAEGIFQLNGSAEAFGTSPGGHSWGNTPWPVAAQRPGARQVGIGRSILERYPWASMAPHPEWVRSEWPQLWYEERHVTVHEPSWRAADGFQAYAAGIPGRLRIIYSPRQFEGPLVTGLEPDARYVACYINPRDGAEYRIGPVTPDEHANWRPPMAPLAQDWVLILETEGVRYDARGPATQRA